MATASVTPALPPGFELDPPPPPGFELDATPAGAPAAGLKTPAAAPRAEIPGIDPRWAAGQDPAQIEERRRAQVAAKNPIAEKVLGAVEGALDIVAKIGGGTVGGMLGLATAPFRAGPADQNMAEGAQAGVEAVRSGYGLLGLPAAQGPTTQTGAALSEGVDKALEGLPPVLGVYGTLAGPAVNAGAAARQVAAPVAQVARQGLDVAGSAVQRGTEAVQGLRRRGSAAAAAPAPTPGTPGSVGAAGLDMATQRRERARSLPVPFEGQAALTEGQATRSFEAQRFERETAKDPDMGAPLRERAAEQNAVALRNLDALEGFTGAKTAERGATGQVVVDAIAKKAERAKKEIDAAYAEARDAGDMAEPIDALPLAKWIEDNRASTGTASVIKTAEDELIRLGGAQRAADGSLVPREITINDLELLRKRVVTDGKANPTNAHYAAQINRVIDAATENRGGELYRVARKKYSDYQAEFKERGAIRDLIGIKKGTNDRITATEKVLERAMRSADDLKNVRETLITAGDGGVQAWREIQGQAMRRLRDDVTKGVATDVRGNPIVSPAKLKQVIDTWDQGGQLEVLFGKKGAETLRDLRDVSQDLFTAPPGAVNTSNTASVMAKWMADSAASFAATGVPLPLVSLTKAAWKARMDRKVKKQVEQALGPKEAPAPRTEPRNPLQGTDTLPETPPRDGGPPKADGGAVPREAANDPQLREIEKLKQNASAEVLRVLEAQEKARQREIRTEQVLRKRAEEAQALEAKAQETTDPALRRALVSRANELRSDRIPVGDAQELPPETGRGLDMATLPVGQATEITRDQARAAAPTKRERKLLQLRDEVTDPEVVKSLDRQIEAERKRAANEERGREFLRLADAVDDPELRRTFEAEAKKLGAVREAEGPIPVPEATELQVETVEATAAAPEPVRLPGEAVAAWAKEWKFGSLDAKAAQDVREARRYDAAAVDAAAQQLDRSPRAFEREISRIIEEGKARESEAQPPAGGSEGSGTPGSGARGQGGGGPDIEGGTPVAGGGRPRAPRPSGDSGGQAGPGAEGVSRQRQAWEQEQAGRFDLDLGGAGWHRPVGNLGEVVVDFTSEPGQPLRATIHADYLGKRFESRTAQGDPAIRAAIEDLAGKVQQGRERMAARVAATERGVAGEAQQRIGRESERFQALAARVGKIDEQKGLSDAESAIERRFGDAVRADPDGFLQRYVQLKDTRGGKVVNTDEARELWHEYSKDNDARATYARAVHEPASWIAKAQWDKLIAEPPKAGKVMLLGGGGGSGKTSSLEGIQPGFDKRFDAIYDTTLASESKAVKAIEQALASGRTVEIVYTARDPLDSIVNGIIKRAKVKGRTVPLEVAAEAHIEAPKVLQKLRERFIDDDRVIFRFVDNTRGPNQQRLVEPRDLPEFDYNDLVGRALRAAADAYEQGSISEAVFRGLAGEAGREGPARLRERLARSGDDDAGAKPAPQHRQGRGPRQEVAAVAGAPAGRVASALTERGGKIQTRYRLLEVDDLITSHDDALRPNPAYDQTLQPRDRARQASEDQIARLANDIKPDLLGESPKASEGSPIIGADAQVESGNARTIALRRAYQSDKAKHYKLWLIDHAEEFGLTAEQVRTMKRPVLVRQGLGEYDRAQFARDANESSVAEVSATERARSDASMLPDLEGLQFDEAGNVDASASADWIRAYVQTTIGPSKRGEVMTATGELSQTGNTRIRNAVLMKAYNDPALVERVAESLDPGTKNILNGMSRAAPDVAKLQDMAAAGAREAPTWVPDLVDAVRRFGDAREAGQTVQQYLGQGSLLGGEASEAVAVWMKNIEADHRAPRRIADHIRALVRESMKDPRQGGLDL